MDRQEIIKRRRGFSLPRYKTLAEVGIDGDWVSPYQIFSASDTGPCVIAYNWLDAPSAIANKKILLQLGYLPGMPFNNVMDMALEYAGLTRRDIYLTQAFHLLPATRSASIHTPDVDTCFDQITKYEAQNRKVVALGEAAANACRRHGIDAIAVCHPSSRTNGTYDDRARLIAIALRKAAS